MASFEILHVTAKGTRSVASVDLAPRPHPFHSDPGHGWLEVMRSQLITLGLKPSDFSRYSYRDRAGLLFYLEEDCDAPKYLRAYREKFGKEPETVEHNTQGDSSIRNLQSIGEGW